MTSEPRGGGRSSARRRLSVLWRRLRGGALTPGRAAASVGVGVFVGALPLYGLHFPLCVAFCLPLRLDVVSAYLAAHINNPFTGAGLLTLEVEVGSLLLTGRFTAFDLERARETGVSGFALQAGVGAVVVGLTLAVVGAAVTGVVAGRRARHHDARLGLDKTIARYERARRADRMYVRGKLRGDPLVSSLRDLGEVGAVLDAGAGRGQFGLLLLDWGAASSVEGFDWDERKVEVARLAASGDAQFSVGSLTERELRGAQTLLLLDVLHYLSIAEQDSLLARAASSLRPGGRLVVREVDEGSGWRAALTRLTERLAIRLGYQRGRTVQVRPSAEIVAVLEASGLECEVGPSSEGTPFSNVVIVARRPDDRQVDSPKRSG